MYGQRLRNFPIAYDATHYTVTEKRLVKKLFYVPTIRNTLNDYYNSTNGFANAFLVSETPTVEEGDGVWLEQVYSTVPADSVDYTTVSAIFPGLVGQRPPQPARTVLGKILRTYHLIGELNGSFASVDGAPSTKQTTLWASGWGIGYILSGNTITLESFTVTVGGHAPGIAVNERTVGGWLFDAMGINFATATGARAAYIGMIGNDATAESYSVVAETTIPTRYLGNIWMFETLVVKAQ